MTDTIRQQCKAKWITYGDECTKYFFAKVKQRKTASYIFELQDEHCMMNQGFLVVVNITLNYYKGLLGEEQSYRRQIDPEVTSMATL